MQRQVHSRISTAYGSLFIDAFAESGDDPMPHLAIYPPGLDQDQPVLVRIHSECLTGDLLGSNRCDCGQQLHESLVRIEQEKGILIYLRQEGRGIGLINKLKAYNLQDEGYNTIDANHQLGFEADERQYNLASYILKEFGICKIRLLTNNPEKMTALMAAGIEIVERIPLTVVPQAENADYLRVKRDMMGHLFD